MYGLHRFLTISIGRSKLRSLTLPLFFCAATTAALAGTAITGTVTNRTVNKPSAGDTVTLIRLAQGMQESTHTTTDRSGHFTLEVPDSDTMHLVRVTHQMASYFQPIPPGTNNADVDVYDAAAKVAGVNMEADVLRLDTDSSGLRVIESFFIKNVSSPPRTQMSAHPFEFYLPQGAQIIGSAALGPGGMPVRSAPVPMGEPGHYTFIFPLRPGETRFQVSYHLPYSGAQEFAPRMTMATDNYAVMLPKSMKFAATAAGAFQSVNEDVNAQTFLAKSVKPGSKIDFKISGSGQLPQETPQPEGPNSPNVQAGPDQAGADQGGAAGAGSAAAGAGPEADTRPGGGLGTPIDTPDPLNKYKWWILSGIGALLAAGAGVLMRVPAPQAAGSTGGASVTAAGAGERVAKGSVLLLALKEELFVLETERLQGRMEQAEYEHQKAALEIVLKRALERSNKNIAPV